ncbi:MAG: YHS domain-containing protein [Rhodospirillaceae bacterium]|jgi:YHS domain-containing protein|nr:YHS domain-containing protein [Rhodospirillaceae bacterium]
MLRNLGLGLAAILFSATLAGAGFAAEINKTLLGNAIEGYDPVAYHIQGKPVEGSGDFTHDWGGATWRFASAENRDLFAADPEKYAPAYGGYCAYGVAQGYKVDIDPQAWSVVDGTLYLNYSKGVQQTWEEDIPGYLAQADAEWPALSAE